MFNENFPEPLQLLVEVPHDPLPNAAILRPINQAEYRRILSTGRRAPEARASTGLIAIR